MGAITIYIIITIFGIGIYYLGFETSINEMIRYATIRRMLRLELTNDIVNTTVIFDRISSEKNLKSQSTIIQDSILSRQISDPVRDKGEELVLYIEKWLLFDARERMSTYRFYADRKVYEASIEPETQFHITLWLKKILETSPDHISAQLTCEGKTIKLIFNEVSSKNMKLDFTMYLASSLRNEMPGSIDLNTNNKIEVAFGMESSYK